MDGRRLSWQHHLASHQVQQLLRCWRSAGQLLLRASELSDYRPKVLFRPWRVMKTDLSRCLVLGCRRRRCIGRFMRSCLRSPVQPLTPERKSSSTLRISYDVIYDACKLSNGFSSQYVMSLRSSVDGRIRFACNSIIIRYGVERKYLELIQKFLKRLNFSACKLKIAKMKESHNHV